MFFLILILNDLIYQDPRWYQLCWKGKSCENIGKQ